jgi:predicted nucleic acid-binding protein
VIVVDASILVTALADDGDGGERVRRRLIDENLAAPELVDLEVTSVLRRLTAQRELDQVRALRAIEDLGDLRIELVSHRPLLERCWQLRDNLTVHDAVYVALAELLEVPLLTADRKVATAPGPTCFIELLTDDAA